MLNIKPYLNQDYEEIRKKCLRSGRLFVDDRFPPSETSLYKYNSFERSIYWKRPKEITKEAKFFVDGANPNDLDQGFSHFNFS
jgi:hypothetical protein